ncbi:hypothetical protein MC885_005402 [Smutsia gigantea]|nr:hypothetical protein MC885_005402 [Smutsia gigantea]
MDLPENQIKPKPVIFPLADFLKDAKRYVLAIRVANSPHDCQTPQWKAAFAQEGKQDQIYRNARDRYSEEEKYSKIACPYLLAELTGVPPTPPLPPLPTPHSDVQLCQQASEVHSHQLTGQWPLGSSPQPLSREMRKRMWKLALPERREKNTDGMVSPKAQSAEGVCPKPEADLAWWARRSPCSLGSLSTAGVATSMRGTLVPQATPENGKHSLATDISSEEP